MKRIWPIITVSDVASSVKWYLRLLAAVNDFDAAWQRAQTLGAPVEEPPNTDNGTGKRAFVVRDPDGYQVAVNEA